MDLVFITLSTNILKRIIFRMVLVPTLFVLFNGINRLSTRRQAFYCDVMRSSLNKRKSCKFQVLGPILLFIAFLLYPMLCPTIYCNLS